MTATTTPLSDEALAQVRAMLGVSYPYAIYDTNGALLLGTARKLLATLDATLDATRAENVRLTVALNGFIWLGNNLHNIALAPVTFRELYEAALVDANKALERSTLTCRP